MERKRRGTLVLLATASFIAVVDTTIVTIALPSIRQSLQFSTSGSQWVLNTYALTFGGLLLLAGRMGDLYGRRRLFSLGLAVFGVGSLVAGFAWGALPMLGGRLLQGAGAAAFVPASLSLLTAAFPREDERSRAVGVYGAMSALGFVVGMVGGGAITELWGWRWVFWVNLPVAALMLLATGTLHESRDPDAAEELDMAGAVIVTCGLVVLIYAMTSVPARGLSWLTVCAGVIAVVLLLVFLLVEKRHRAPLVPLRRVARPVVLLPNGSIALLSMVGIAWLYVLTLYFQDVLGQGPLKTGLLFAPMTLASLVAAPVGGRMASRFGVRATAVTGLAMVGGGLAIMTAGMTAPGSVPVVVSGMTFGEGGFMLSSVSLTLAGTSSLEDDRAGLAAGLLNTSIQLGSGLGLGIVAVVIAARLSTEAGGSYAGALRWGLLTCLCFVVVALPLVGRLPRGRSSRPTP